MVSGFVTSPEDQSRICLLDASPIRIASNSLMSINSAPQSLPLDPLVLDLNVGEVCLAHRPDLGLNLFSGRLARLQLDVREVVERLVLGKRELAVLVDALLALLGLLGRRLPRGCAQRAG